MNKSSSELHAELMVIINAYTQRLKSDIRYMKTTGESIDDEITQLKNRVECDRLIINKYQEILEAILKEYGVGSNTYN